MKRTFVAFDIVPEPELQELINNLRYELNNEKVKWVHPKGFHVSIRFMGNSTNEQISRVRNSLEDIAFNRSPMLLSLAGLGIFKGIYEPRVIFTKVEQDPLLWGLRDEINRVMDFEGFGLEEKEYQPHLTLCRLKKLDAIRPINVLLERYKDKFVQQVSVNEIVLYESILTRKGPYYKVIEKYTLEG